MRYLLDTHIILWALVGDKRVDKIKEILLDAKNEILYSSVSTWEVSLKNQKKKDFKLTDEQFVFLCDQNGLSNIQITNKHICELKNIKKELQVQHNDPFDLLLLAQAINENAVLITHDSKFEAYSNPNIMLV